MSFIHCSPLFIPLEPLPIMSPEVMRNQRKKSNSSKNSPGATTSPSAQRKDSPSTKDKGKRPATSPPTLYPSPTLQPPTAQVYEPMIPPHQLMAPHPGDLTDSDLIMVQALTAEPQQDPSQTISYPDSVEAHADTRQSSSFQEGSYDSDAHAALTLTVESQPMSDLSSSQQIE